MSRQLSAIDDNFDPVTVAILPGSGGRVFYRRERTRATRSLAEKLFAEVAKSLDVAQTLSSFFTNEVIVHVDANVDERHRSSRYVQALAGMVVGYGYQVRVKPEAWCATHVADFVVKEKNQRAA